MFMYAYSGNKSIQVCQSVLVQHRSHANSCIQVCVYSVGLEHNYLRHFGSPIHLQPTHVIKAEFVRRLLYCVGALTQVICAAGRTPCFVMTYYSWYTYQ